VSAPAPVHAAAGAGLDAEGRRPLVVVGDFAWDVLIRTNTELLRGGDTYGEVELAPGGSAANVAVWARRCGLATAFVGKVGRDRFGALAEENLQGERVEAYLIRTDAHLTGSVAVLVDHTGERSMVSGKGADHALLPQELPRELIASARHLHLSGWSFFDDPPRAAARAAARIARSAGATVSLDPGSFQMIAGMGVEAFVAATSDLGLDLFFPNYEEANTLTGETEPERMARALRDRYPGASIALKLDADGALVLEAGAEAAITVPPSVNRLIDATGAGDAFAGAYLSRALRGDTADEAGRFAVMVSEWVIQHLGARPELDGPMRTRLAKLG
jgi:ribokinase